MKNGFSLKIKHVPQLATSVAFELNAIDNARAFIEQVKKIKKFDYDSQVYLESAKKHATMVIQKNRKAIKRSGQFSVILRHGNTGLSTEMLINSLDDLHSCILIQRENLLREIRLERGARKEISTYTGYYTLRSGWGIRYFKRGNMIMPGEIARLAAERFAKIVFESKRPLNNEKHIGIELEFIAALGREKLAEKLVKAKLGRYVCLKGDGSIRVDRSGYFAHEINILVTESERKAIVSRVVEVLREADARVNKSCGFHVHLDMRTRSREKAFNNLVGAQNVFYAMNPKSRKESTYCKKTTSRDLEKERRGSRYKGVNAAALSKFGTLEIRIHAGTVDEVKINNWIDLLVTVADADSSLKRAPRKLDTFCKGYNIPAELRSYIIERIRKFNNGDEVGEVSEVV